MAIVRQSLAAANDVWGIALDVQAIFFRRHHQPRRPPLPTSEVPHLLVGWAGGPERASYAEKGEFTEREHAVFGTAVEVRYVDEIVPDLGHKSDDFRDRVLPQAPPAPQINDSTKKM